MSSDQLLKCCVACKSILENHAEEAKRIGFTALRKELNENLGSKVSYENYERALAVVNHQSWRERKVILTSIVRCKQGLPGMRLWILAKSLGAIPYVPTDYFHQKEFASLLTEAVFKAYAFDKSDVIH